MSSFYCLPGSSEGKNSAKILANFYVRFAVALKGLVCKVAVEHQIRYTKRVDLRTDVAVQVVPLGLGGVVCPSQLNAKCGHHFKKKLPKYRFKTRPVGLGAHYWLLVLM